MNSAQPIKYADEFQAKARFLIRNSASIRIKFWKWTILRWPSVLITRSPEISYTTNDCGIEAKRRTKQYHLPAGRPVSENIFFNLHGEFNLKRQTVVGRPNFTRNDEYSRSAAFSPVRRSVTWHFTPTLRRLSARVLFTATRVFWQIVSDYKITSFGSVATMPARCFFISQRIQQSTSQQSTVNSKIKIKIKSKRFVSP